MSELWTPPTLLGPPLPVSDWVPVTSLSDENNAKTKQNQVELDPPYPLATPPTLSCLRPASGGAGPHSSTVDPSVPESWLNLY